MYQAQEKTVITYISSFAENLAVAGCSFALAYLFGENGIWASSLAADILLLFSMLIYVWISNRKVTLSVYDVMLLNRNFGVSKDDRLSRTIYSLNDSINISEDVIDFCKQHEINRRISNASGLCVEETSILLFKYAFGSVKNPQVDVRLIMKDNTLTIRLRNNGRNIFPGKKLEIIDSEDPLANIGIKLLAKLTDDINCNSILGLNVITIKIGIET